MCACVFAIDAGRSSCKTDVDLCFAQAESRRVGQRVRPVCRVDVPVAVFDDEHHFSAVCRLQELPVHGRLCVAGPLGLDFQSQGERALTARRAQQLTLRRRSSSTTPVRLRVRAPHAAQRFPRQVIWAASLAV